MRYKGKPSFKAIERDFPHAVVMPIPPGGFGQRLILMHRWHRAAGIDSREGNGWRVNMCWCFADAATADRFQAEFGGERRDFPRPDRSRAGHAGRSWYAKLNAATLRRRRSRG